MTVQTGQMYKRDKQKYLQEDAASTISPYSNASTYSTYVLSLDL
jgi:hypothetical protein